MAIVKTQKYKDLPFFITKNSFTNDINTVNDISAIRQSIKNLTLTSRGERPFDYGFGANLQSALFENYNLELVATIQSSIAENLRLYEPRAVLNNIRVYETPNQANSVNVDIEFTVPDLNISDLITIELSRTR